MLGPSGVWGVCLWTLMERWVRMGGGEGYWSLEAANGSKSWSWPTYMCCGRGS